MTNWRTPHVDDISWSRILAFKLARDQSRRRTFWISGYFASRRLKENSIGGLPGWTAIRSWPPRHVSLVSGPFFSLLKQQRWDDNTRCHRVNEPMISRTSSLHLDFSRKWPRSFFAIHAAHRYTAQWKNDAHFLTHNFYEKFGAKIKK